MMKTISKQLMKTWFRRTCDFATHESLAASYLQPSPSGRLTLVSRNREPWRPAEKHQVTRMNARPRDRASVDPLDISGQPVALEICSFGNLRGEIYSDGPRLGQSTRNRDGHRLSGFAIFDWAGSNQHRFSLDSVEYTATGRWTHRNFGDSSLNK